MTAAEACAVLVDQVREISTLRRLAEDAGDVAASLRLVTVQALTALHDEQRRYQHLRERYERLSRENRELRATLMIKAAA